MREVIRPFNARLREPLKPVIRRIYADGDTAIAFFDSKAPRETANLTSIRTHGSSK